MTRKRTWLAASLVLVLALVGNWWLTRTDLAGSDANNRAPATFDYALSDFDAVLFDADGRISMRVSGPRLEHDPETRAARLIQPRFVLPGDEADWAGRADNGLIERNDETLTLLGNVEATRPHPRGQVVIEAQRLDHDRRTAQLTSDRPVRVRQAGDELSGGTLVYFMNDDRVELEHDVHAIFRDGAAGNDSRDPSGTDFDRGMEPGPGPGSDRG